MRICTFRFSQRSLKIRSFVRRDRGYPAGGPGVCVLAHPRARNVSACAMDDTPRAPSPNASERKRDKARARERVPAKVSERASLPKVFYIIYMCFRVNKNASVCPRSCLFQSFYIMPNTIASMRPKTSANGMAHNPNINLINSHHLPSCIKLELYIRVIVG